MKLQMQMQVKRMRGEYGKLNKAQMSIWECIELLNSFVDESDPDLDEPQIEHLLQTAEAIRKDYPNEDWLHLTALIHGKYPMHIPNFRSEYNMQNINSFNLYVY
jgi:inositol oxygenase